MAGFRAYFETQTPPRSGGTIELSEPESRHLCGSLRAVQGNRVTLFNLRGALAECTILYASRTKAVLGVDNLCAPAERKTDITLAICLPASSVFDEILRQAVEIGASAIIPLFSENSQVRLNAKDAEKKMSKWRARLIEAVKQSANFSPFEIFAPVSAKDFLKSQTGKKSFDVKFCASLEADSKPLLELALSEIKTPLDKICVLVGPEGDLSKAEYALAREAQFLPATLGENVMKCDTACAAALSILNAAARQIRPAQKS